MTSCMDVIDNAVFNLKPVLIFLANGAGRLQKQPDQGLEDTGPVRIGIFADQRHINVVITAPDIGISLRASRGRALAERKPLSIGFASGACKASRVWRILSSMASGRGSACSSICLD